MRKRVGSTPTGGNTEYKMLIVTVQVLPFGLEGYPKKEIARVEIGNDGTGTDTIGNYSVRSFRRGSTEIVQREGKVLNHRRKSEHVLTLLKKSLEKMGY